MIELKDVHKTYAMGDTTVYALRGVSLKIAAGEYVAITGPSGSGKSTLMHVIGLLDTPESGSYRLLDREVAHLEEDDLAVLRREAIGFVFQQFNLLPRTAADENVAMPLIYSSHGLDLQRAQELLAQVGLGKRAHHKSNELSGGQQQREHVRFSGPSDFVRARHSQRREVRVRRQQDGAGRQVRRQVAQRTE